MNVDEDIVKRVASNARINLSEEEVSKFVSEFQEVLDAFSSLSEVDTDNVLPSFQPISIPLTFRKDSPKVCLSTEDALSNSTHKKDNFFVGPSTK